LNASPTSSANPQVSELLCRKEPYPVLARGKCHRSGLQ
jgi:hypothetical protein